MSLNYKSNFKLRATVTKFLWQRAQICIKEYRNYCIYFCGKIMRFLTFQMSSEF